MTVRRLVVGTENVGPVRTKKDRDLETGVLVHSVSEGGSRGER